MVVGVLDDLMLLVVVKGVVIVNVNLMVNILDSNFFIEFIVNW